MRRVRQRPQHRVDRRVPGLRPSRLPAAGPGRLVVPGRRHGRPGARAGTRRPGSTAGSRRPGSTAGSGPPGLAAGLDGRLARPAEVRASATGRPVRVGFGRPCGLRRRCRWTGRRGLLGRRDRRLSAGCRRRSVPASPAAFFAAAFFAAAFFATAFFGRTAFFAGGLLRRGLLRGRRRGFAGRPRSVSPRDPPGRPAADGRRRPPSPWPASAGGGLLGRRRPRRGGRGIGSASPSRPSSRPPSSPPWPASAAGRFSRVPADRPRRGPSAPAASAAARACASRSCRSRSRTRAVSSATSSAVARPTTPSARSTSYRTMLVSASRLATPVDISPRPGPAAARPSRRRG